MPTDLTLSQAIQSLAGLLPRPTAEAVPLEAALGRVLAAPLAARADHPSVDDSAMDGYAVREADTLAAAPDAPVTLAVLGESAAGAAHAGPVGPGQAVRIFTGAAVPPGADAIVRVEDTRPAGGGVLLLAPGNPRDIRRRAQDLVVGRAYLNPGRRLGPAEIALAAGMGHAVVPVFRRPRVGILATGDELTPPGAEPVEGGVFESNSFGLLALAQAAGWDAARLENVPDTLDATRAALDAAAGFDWLLTSGGVSMGERDFARKLLETEGVLAFKRARIRPGGPVLAASWRGLPVVGLPGNPVSALVVFQVLLWPAWWAAVGGEGPANPSVPAVAAEPLRGTAGKLTFARVALEVEGGRLAARPFQNQSSGVLRSLVESQGLAAIPEDVTVGEGETVEVLLPFR